MTRAAPAPAVAMAVALAACAPGYDLDRPFTVRAGDGVDPRLADGLRRAVALLQDGPVGDPQVVSLEYDPGAVYDGYVDARRPGVVYAGPSAAEVAGDPTAACVLMAHELAHLLGLRGHPLDCHYSVVPLAERPRDGCAVVTASGLCVYGDNVTAQGCLVAPCAFSESDLDLVCGLVGGGVCRRRAAVPVSR